MIEPTQHLVEGPIDDLPISEEERTQLRRLQKTGRSLELRNAELLERLQDKAENLINSFDAREAVLAGDNLKDILAIADATTRYTKSIREDENIRAKLARKAVGKKRAQYDDVGVAEAKALLTALAKVYTPEQIMKMLPVTIEQ